MPNARSERALRMEPEHSGHIGRDIQTTRLPQIPLGEGAIDEHGFVPYRGGPPAAFFVAAGPAGHPPGQVARWPSKSDDRPITCKRPNGLIERDAVDVPDKLDDITAALTATTVPELTFQVNGESVMTTADGTGAAQLSSDALEPDTSATEFVLKANGLGVFYRWLRIMFAKRREIGVTSHVRNLFLDRHRYSG
jgi:hypothetical protein